MVIALSLLRTVWPERRASDNGGSAFPGAHLDPVRPVPDADGHVARRKVWRHGGIIWVERKSCIAMAHPFHSLYTHGFVRAAVCVPFMRVADPAHNAARTLALARRASDARAAVALFPELGSPAYSDAVPSQQAALA